MSAKQQWEAARRTCETLSDMAVDPQTTALLRQVQAQLRQPVQAKQAREAYRLCDQARDALTQGDKADAQRLLSQVLALFAAGNETAGKADAPASRTAPAAAESPAEEKAAVPQRPSVIRRSSMAILNKLRSAFGGERGKQAAQNAMLTDKREAIERQIAVWENQMSELQKERDRLQASLAEKVEQARTLDKTSAAYTKLRHEAMVIKPQIDTLNAQVSRLMTNIEKYAKVSAVYRSGQLTAQTQLNERDLTEASVLVEQINDQIDVAADLDQELDKVLEKSDKVQQRMLDQAAEQADSFFDSLVSGETPAADDPDDPFAALVADANARAEEAPASPEAPAEKPSMPLEM